MRKKISKPYFAIAIALVCLLSVPVALTESLRSAVTGMVTPLWSFFHKGHLALDQTVTKGNSQLNKETARLELENAYLYQELVKAKRLFEEEKHIQHLISRLSTLKKAEDQGFAVSRLYQSLSDTIQLQLKATPAKVIYRDPSSWSSSMWLDLGEKDNHNELLIAKNSPVLLGGAVVGLVDLVKENRSRVRLITDSGLVPSVRSARGFPQNTELLKHIDALSESLAVRNDLFASFNDNETLLDYLEVLKQNVSHNYSDILLAKGELHGGGAPLWRSQNQLLKGVGFNYDHADSAGPSRDLRTGHPTGSSLDTASISILEEGDLLLTTGMDGVFPEGLPVARVVKRYTLKEGGYTYELDAKPIAGNLDDLAEVFVLPPVSASYL